MDAAVAPLLEAAVKALAEGALQALRASPDDATLQEAGGKFLSVAAGNADAGTLLDLGAGEVLAAALRRHPRARRVQGEAQWALLRLKGREAAIAVLQDRGRQI